MNETEKLKKQLKVFKIALKPSGEIRKSLIELAKLMKIFLCIVEEFEKNKDKK